MLQFKSKEKYTFLLKNARLIIKYVNVLTTRKHQVVFLHHPKMKEDRIHSRLNNRQIKNEFTSTVKRWNPKTDSKLIATSICLWIMHKHLPHGALFRCRLSNPDLIIHCKELNIYRH